MHANVVDLNDQGPRGELELRKEHWQGEHQTQFYDSRDERTKWISALRLEYGCACEVEQVGYHSSWIQQGAFIELFGDGRLVHCAQCSR